MPRLWHSQPRRPEGPLATPVQQQPPRRKRGLMTMARLRRRKGRRRSAGSSHRLRWDAVETEGRRQRDVVRIDEITFSLERMDI